MAKTMEEVAAEEKDLDEDEDADDDAVFEKEDDSF